MVSKVLSGLDGEANLHTRLRYGTATARPRSRRALGHRADRAVLG